MKFLNSLIQFLVAPMAIGIYFTFLISYSAWTYYIDRNSEFEELPAFIQLLNTVDHKSIDFRLLARGPRAGSPDVALLTVDEKAVSTVGRWPWPRETIAKAYKSALDHGAKVLALDVIFSEPSDQPANDVFQIVSAKTKLSPLAQEIFQEEIRKKNSDRILTKVVEKYSDRIVLGTFFDEEDTFQDTPGHVDRCNGMIFKNSRTFEIWNQEDQLPIISDMNLQYIPEIIEQIYGQLFDTIEEEIRMSEETPTTSQAFLEQNQRVLRAKREFCFSFLDPESDAVYPTIAENWEAIRAQADIPETSFDEWIENFKYQSRMNSLTIAEHWVMNIDSISNAAKHTGYFNAIQDSDGSIRRARLMVRTGSHYMPALALKAYLLAENLAPEISLEYDPALNRKTVQKFGFIDLDTGEPTHTLQTDRFGNMIINYAGPQKMFPYVSMADMLTDSETMPINQNVWNPKTKSWDFDKKIEVQKSDFLKDKILIFGATATAIYDLRVTPFDENFPGAETHVNIVDNLLRNDFLTVSKQEEWQMPLTLLGLGLFLSFLLTQLGALSGVFFTGLLLTGVIWGDHYFFFSQGIVTSVMFPVILISGLYVLLTFYKYLTEERGKKELKQTFQKYVSPAVVDEILSDPGNIELGGKKLEMTVFFSDVRGFTTISEKLDPRDLSDLLNFYLTPMTDLVFKNKGTLDKYMGDAVMAFFGAPIPYPDHANNACHCALESLEKLKEINKALKEKALPLIDIGIGLNTGEMSVGNMGSETVRSYTVMGDAVNLGSRLEGINKQYGTRTIISEFTKAAIDDRFFTREIDLVRVKGKELPVKIFELVGEDQISPEQSEVLKHFKAGYDLYHQRKFREALSAFEQALSVNPDDGCSQLYVQRCNDFLETPPPEDWDGVFVMTSK